MESEFEDDISIDPTQLDVEVLRQGETFIKWAERAAEARKEAERLRLALDVEKEELRTLEAELSLDCRANPESFGLEKATDKSVEQAVACHEKITKKTKRMFKVREELNSAWANTNLLDRAVDAMEQKKRMLELLVTLHGQSYFAGPSTPRDLGRSWERKKRESEKRLNKRITKVVRRRKG